ncbi:MAG: HigA family addiction module antitoxin [bacterium]
MNYKNIRPTILIPPGEHIKEELEEREWTQKEFAEILGVTPKTISNIIKGKQGITPEMANLIGKAFGTSAEVWMNLETNYRIRLTTDEEKEKAVEAKSILFDNLPINELKKKDWLKAGADIIDSIKNILGINNITESYFESKLGVNFRKSDKKEQITNHAKIWVEMSKRIAEGFHKNITNYDKSKLIQVIKNLHKFSNKGNGIAEFIELLNENGVIFFVLSHLSKTYIDGASFLSDNNPVIVYTKRYDRIDNFWFVIAHELGHVIKHINNQNDYFWDDLKDNNGDYTGIEKEADEIALDLLKKHEITVFFEDYNKIYEDDIIDCSKKIDIHPGIVVGILQHEKKLSYRYHNKLKGKVSNLIPDEYIKG